MPDVIDINKNLINDTATKISTSATLIPESYNFVCDPNNHANIGVIQLFTWNGKTFCSYHEIGFVQDLITNYLLTKKKLKEVHGIDMPELELK